MTSASLSKLMNYLAGFKYLNLWHIAWWLIQVMRILEELSSDILPPEVSPEVAHEGIHLTVVIGTSVAFFAWCLFSCSPLVINRELCWAALKLCKHPVSWETFTSGFGMLTFTAMDMNGFKMGLSSSIAPPRTLVDTVGSRDPILNHSSLSQRILYEGVTVWMWNVPRRLMCLNTWCPWWCYLGPRPT